MSPATRRAPEPGEAAIFAALGDDTRLSLVRALSRGEPRSLARLTAETTLTRQAVAKHLHVLSSAGLVTSARVGRETRYLFAPAALERARTCLEAVSAEWDDALGRLRAFVERER